MKTPFFKYFVLTTFLATAIVGCGKEASKGSSAPGGAAAPEPVTAPVVTLPPVTNTATNDTTTAMNNLKAWYAAADTVTSLKFRGTFQTVTSASSGISGSFSLCIGSWGVNCKATSSTPTNCYVKSADQVNYDLGVPDKDSTFACKITQSAVTKSTNAELAKAINGEGNLVLLQAYSQQNGVYVVTWGTIQMNGYPVQSKRYVIDTNAHSILNPVQSFTTSNTTYKTNIVSFEY